MTRSMTCAAVLADAVTVSTGRTALGQQIAATETKETPATLTDLYDLPPLKGCDPYACATARTTTLFTGSCPAQKVCKSKWHCDPAMVGVPSSDFGKFAPLFCDIGANINRRSTCFEA